MRTLAIADLHIKEGRNFNECSNALDQVVGYAKHNEVDNLVVLGDIYHTAQPTKKEERLFQGFLLKCQAQSKHIVLGNHDWQPNGFHSISELDMFADEFKFESIFVHARSTFMFDNEHNNCTYHCIPWLPKVKLDNMSLSEYFTKSMDKIHAESEDKNVIVFAHVLLSGANLATGHNIKHGTLPENFFDKYMDRIKVVMLGDVHKHQYLGNNILYCGSIIRTDFGEIGEEKYMHIIEDDGRNIVLKRQQLDLTPMLAYHYGSPQQFLDNNNEIERGTYVDLTIDCTEAESSELLLQCNSAISNLRANLEYLKVTYDVTRNLLTHDIDLSNKSSDEDILLEYANKRLELNDKSMQAFRAKAIQFLS